MYGKNGMLADWTLLSVMPQLVWNLLTYKELRLLPRGLLSQGLRWGKEGGTGSVW